MTTEQIKALRDKYLPGNFAQYRAELREEARRLGHKVGANDIIKVLEANANDDNRVITDAAEGRTPWETGPETPEPEEGKPDAKPQPMPDGERRDGGEGAPPKDFGDGEGEGEGDGEPKPDTPKAPANPFEDKPKDLPSGKAKGEDIPTPSDDAEAKAEAKRQKMTDELFESLFDDEDAESKAKQEALKKQMAEAEEAERAARKKQEEAEKLRKELDELRKRQEAKRKQREEEERKRREEEARAAIIVPQLFNISSAKSWLKDLLEKLPGKMEGKKEEGA